MDPQQTRDAEPIVPLGSEGAKLPPPGSHPTKNLICIRKIKMILTFLMQIRDS